MIHSPEEAFGALEADLVCVHEALKQVSHPGHDEALEAVGRIASRLSMLRTVFCSDVQEGHTGADVAGAVGEDPQWPPVDATGSAGPDQDV